MKKRTRMPDAAKQPGKISSPDPGQISASAVRESFAARVLWRTAELFACLLTVLLPIKFASFVSTPEGGALYWSDPVPLLVISWPLPVFMMAASVLLVLTLAAAL